MDMATVLSPPEERVLLHDVSWETYERLLVGQQDKSTPRQTYDRGALEIASPSGEHEEINDLIKQLVFVLAEESGLEFRSFGSKTFKRADLQKSFEPDSCFYIQSLNRISGISDPDLSIQPPPDLVVEIDITHPSLDKLPIYAKVGIPEVWIYDGSRITIYLLQEGNYVACEESIALPRVTATNLTRFIAEARTQKRSVWVRAVREWASAP